MRSIYIAGPMSGCPEFNFPAFNAAQRRLEEAGWRVFNPANKAIEDDLVTEAIAGGDTQGAIEGGFDFKEAYLWDVEKVINADAILMLRGWELSHGARGEHAVALAIKSQFPEYEIIYE